MQNRFHWITAKTLLIGAFVLVGTYVTSAALLPVSFFPVSFFPVSLFPTATVSSNAPQSPYGATPVAEEKVPYGRTGEFGYRHDIPDWKFDKRFPSDSFRFVRLQYPSYQSGYDNGNYNRGYGGGRRGRGGRGGWLTDYPDSDLNFSFRLQQLTSLKVDPEPTSVRPIDPELFDYPFVYMIEPYSGQLDFDENDAKLMRKYLLNGGFMMVDDFWDQHEYNWFYREIKKVFPDREPEKLTLEHGIFHNVYDLQEIPQVPSIHSWERYGGSSDRYGEKANYYAIYDDHDRMCVFIGHNTDLGDGWEREGENREYFELYSEKQSYPMGINIITWAMTH